MKEGTVEKGDEILSSKDTVSYSFKVENTGHTCLNMSNVEDENVDKLVCSDMDMSGARNVHSSWHVEGESQVCVKGRTQLSRHELAFFSFRLEAQPLM